VFRTMGVGLVVHSVMVDGLQKMRHFRKAGEHWCLLIVCVGLALRLSVVLFHVLSPLHFVHL
jgi:hypothetical protein